MDKDVIVANTLKVSGERIGEESDFQIKTKLIRC